jgi:Protein of unknown function (DUF429)
MRGRDTGALACRVVMRTLGIDLAAQDKKTAYCAIEWLRERARIELPRVGRTEADVLAEMERADWIGIDAPFGWPDAMVEAVHAYAGSDAWPANATPERLRYRETDWFVHKVVADEAGTSVWPLSVSSDRIAVCAWRCANLLRAHSERTGWKLDRIGVPPPDAARSPGGVVEVYPAAALALWGLPHKGYKSTSAAAAVAAREKRIAIIAELEQAAATWLTLTDDVREACIDSDDAFDALVSSLVACAAAADLTVKPLAQQRGAAQREGWIHLPSSRSIRSLAPATSR